MSIQSIIIILLTLLLGSPANLQMLDAAQKFLPHHPLEKAEEFAITVWHKLTKWKVTHFQSLPQWLQDNDFLHFGHRPPLPTSECFKSIVRIHTETGNIWTHLLGTLLGL